MKKNKLHDVIDKKMQKSTNLNQFDIHVNKKKPTILGQKSKNDRGLPGISRDKNLKIQKKTLLAEYNNLNKSNVFIDKRIGEKNMTPDERTLARYSKDMNSYYEQKEREMLKDWKNDDPEFQSTHKGQKLSEIERFPTHSSDDESDEEDKFMALELQKEAFFDDGGGDGSKAKRPYKEVIKDFVIESKIRKLERKALKDETTELTEELDSYWKEMQPVMERYKKSGDEINYKNQYDSLVSQFRNECFASATDKLKSQEEVLSEERERVDEVEKERLKRMAAPFERRKAVPHRSVDALDDDFAYDDQMYVDGDDGDDGDADEDEEDDEDEDDSEVGQDGSEDEEEELKGENNEEDGDGDNGDSDNEENGDTNNSKINGKNDSGPESTEHVTIPDTFDQFQALLTNKTLSEQTSFIAAMTSSNRSNKKKSSLLFQFVFNFGLDLADNPNENNRYNRSMEFLQKNYDCLFELLNVDKERSWHFMLAKMQEVVADYRKNGEQNYPKLSTLVFLKLIRLCLPTSDFRHQIVTSAVLLISQMLFVCQVVTRYDISYGLLLCATIKEYVSESKRYCPETVVFLENLFGLVASKSWKKTFEKCPKNALLIDKNETVSSRSELNKFGDDEIDNSYRNWTVSVTIRIIGDFLDFYKDLSAVVFIFDQFFENLESLDAESYDPEITEAIHNLKSKFAEIKSTKKYVKLHEKKKSKMLRLLEPKFGKILDRQKDFGEQQRNDDHEMFRKFKREKRGAIRKIRRDNEYLTRVKIKEIRQGDRERKEKVKRIFGDASIQQHELKKLEKIKKKFQ